MAFLNLYVSNGFHAVKACIALGMTPRSAHAHAYRYVDAIRDRMTLQHAMRESGLDVRLIARMLARLMDATEPSGTAPPNPGTRSRTPQPSLTLLNRRLAS
jgi:hypothetical protein